MDRDEQVKKQRKNWSFYLSACVIIFTLLLFFTSGADLVIFDTYYRESTRSEYCEKDGISHNITIYEKRVSKTCDKYNETQVSYVEISEAEYIRVQIKYLLISILCDAVVSALITLVYWRKIKLFFHIN